jgi:hypothetical protein
LLILAIYIALSIHQWKRHSDGIGLSLALICTALSAIILRNEIVEGIKKSRQRIKDQPENV